MLGFAGSPIFWITGIAVICILTLSTVLGRAWAGLMPAGLQGSFKFYLAPAVGLATLTLVASLLGRYTPLGDSIAVPMILAMMLVWAIRHEASVRVALRHTLLVSGFGLVCGASVLAPLFLYGAFNLHNDAYSYLAHSQWLQQHAFNEFVTPQVVSASTAQISLYQTVGLRMGASFLLALMQSILNLAWAANVYPAVAISAVAVCCLTIGFPLSRILRPLRRPARLALLSIPAFTFGGVVFSASFGFLPQVVGLAFSAGLLFQLGVVTRLLVVKPTTSHAIARAALPSAALLAAAVFAYSEISPLLVPAVIASGCFYALRYRSFAKPMAFTGMVLVLATLVLNSELARAYTALRTQTGAVVGSPVDWSLLGFVAHAFGVHGGAWDGFQWSTPTNMGTTLSLMGLGLTAAAFAALVAARKSLWANTWDGTLVPAVTMLGALFAGVLYFRYFVESPFPVGKGQSWSQFKLADWAHPFAAGLLVLALANLLPRIGKPAFHSGLAVVFSVGLIASSAIGITRTAPLMHFYSGVKDLEHYLLDFRKTVLQTCPRTVPVYLALGGDHHKFRQLALLYLDEREVLSDWRDDGYIYSRLPLERQALPLEVGYCVVEPRGQATLLTQATPIGPYQVGLYEGAGQVRVVSAAGAYDREADGRNWWHWVAKKVVFTVQSTAIPADITHTRFQIEFNTRGAQTVRIHIALKSGTAVDFQIASKGEAMTSFDKTLEVAPREIDAVSVETDGLPTLLGPQDHRVAAMIVRNVKVSHVQK